MDEIWGYQMLNEGDSCTLTLTAGCSHSVSPQIDVEESVFHIITKEVGNVYISVIKDNVIIRLSYL